MISLKDRLVDINVADGVDPENLMLGSDWIGILTPGERSVWSALMANNGDGEISFQKLAASSHLTLNATKTALFRLESRKLLILDFDRD